MAWCKGVKLGGNFTCKGVKLGGNVKLEANFTRICKVTKKLYTEKRNFTPELYTHL
nr:MAG TPA: hypothetical protein [Caudoviricetes sp.]